MFTKILAVVSLVLFPLSVVYWHRSHHHPVRYRFDVTLYKSLDVYLKSGVCGLHLLSMPTKTASRTEFESTWVHDPSPNRASFLLSSSRRGSYRYTWLVFPFWLPTAALLGVGLLPVIRGPVRRWWRTRAGRCISCGYYLMGNASGRCPECGEPVRGPVPGSFR